MLRPVRTLQSHEGAVHVVRYNASGQYCLSGGQDKEVHLSNPSTGNKIKAYVAHGKPQAYRPLLTTANDTNV